MNTRKKLRIKFIAIILLAVVVGLISYPNIVKKVPFLYKPLNSLKYSLGLDLQGGYRLEYSADVSKIEAGKVPDALQAAQDVIERRVNAFGVGEPLVQVANRGTDHRIIVELPGIKNIEEAKNKIKDAPLLEFKEEGGTIDPQIKQMFEQTNTESKKKAAEILIKAKAGEDFAQLAKDNSSDPGSKDKGGDLDFVKRGTMVAEFDKILFDSNLKPGEIYPDLVETQYGWHIIKFIESRGEGDNLEVHSAHILFGKQDPSQYPEFKYKETGLTGKNLKSASVQFAQQGISEPEVLLQFDEEGTKLFADITKRNLGKQVAIFLDGELQMAPTVNSEIANGQAVITGNYTPQEAKDISKRLNEGALPVPLTIVSTQGIESSLGAESLQKSLIAGAIGLGAVIIFMLFYYRFLGLVASVALLIYTGIMISILKLSGITMTLSGIAGFVLSIGMAVDANILIFERTKEEIRKGRTVHSALTEGFKRAWTSIRDGNVSSLLTAGILYLLGTGFVKGFAATLFIGVLVSMFTAVVVSKTILNYLIGEWIYNKLWAVGVKKKDISE
jgi:protein-export membrane protein SecD